MKPLLIRHNVLLMVSKSFSNFLGLLLFSDFLKCLQTFHNYKNVSYICLFFIIDLPKVGCFYILCVASHYFY